MCTFFLVWMYVVGIPLAYYIVTRSGEKDNSWFAMAASHTWPVSIPVLLFVVLFIKRVWK